MTKSKLRSKILNLRKKNSHKKLSLNPFKIYRFLKKNKINFKNVGGYYTCNNEIDDLDMLNFLSNKINKRLALFEIDTFNIDYKELIKLIDLKNSEKFSTLNDIDEKKVFNVL